MSSINFQFDRPWVFIALIPVLALILIPFFRLPSVRRKTFKKIAPAVLHCIIATLLIIVLAGSSIVKTSNEQQVMILMDLSDSTESVQETILAKAEEIKALIGKKTTTGVLAFADDTVYEIKSGESGDLYAAELDSDATDIGGALNTAASYMTAESAARIILLSDGRETESDASAAAYFLKTSGIRIDAMYFDTTSLNTAEMQISSVTCSEGAYVGDEVTISVEITSNIAGNAVLSLSDNGNDAGDIDVTVNEGTTVVSLSTVPTSAGVHTYIVSLDTPSDTISENNSCYAYADIAGESTVLIICDRIAESTELEALLSETCSVTTVTAGNAPDSIVDLCNYDEIIMLNVDNDDLPSDFAELAESYVEDYGRSFLAVGGKDTFMYGNMEETAFEDFLPVNFTLTEGDGNSVAIMLVIDCSMSMAQTGNYLTLAKQGAIKCVEALSEQDYVGVISFNSNATVNREIIQATEENKASVSRTISGLTTSQGTYYVKALTLAKEQLDSCDADVKYCMFLSDGEPSDQNYIAAVKSMAAEGITVSTISIGYTSSVLSAMAETGNGRYYSATRATDLPDIMVSETEQVTISSYITGEFALTIANSTALTEGISAEEIPTISGYLGTTLKDDATAILTTEDGRPIYAEWQYGSGKAAVFTSDLSGSWTSGWFESETGKALISRIVETSIASSHHDSSMEISYSQKGESINVSVTTVSDATDGTVTLNVSNGTEVTTATLTKTTTGSFEGSFTAETPGVYSVIATWQDESGDIKDYIKSAYAVSYSEEYNAFGASGESVLEAVVSYSGGSVTDDTAYLASIKMTNASTVTDPLAALTIIALVLFLLDVAIRKIRLKDVIAFFRKK